MLMNQIFKQKEVKGISCVSLKQPVNLCISVFLHVSQRGVRRVVSNIRTQTDAHFLTELSNKICCVLFSYLPLSNLYQNRFPPIFFLCSCMHVADLSFSLVHLITLSACLPHSLLFTCYLSVSNSKCKSKSFLSVYK